MSMTTANRRALRNVMVGLAPFVVWACGSASVKGSATTGTTPTPGNEEGGTPSTSDASIGVHSSPPPAGSSVSQLDASPENTGLPPLPTLTNVVATQREDSVGIDFDPVDDAVDYRVYPLSDPSDVAVNSDGSVTIKNAVYRCAGQRETFDVPSNSSGVCVGVMADASVAFGPNMNCPWSVKLAANPTLGYVYVTPASGSVPVYAIGVHPAAPEAGWRESRPKIYTTDSGARQTLLGQGWRDDGVVFYVPAAASSATQTIYHSEAATSSTFTEYYFGSSDVTMHAKDSTPSAAAFQVLAAQADGTKPLMSVFYEPGQNHDELAVGTERYKRASQQGQGPLWHLEWAGLTKATTLVVEALASGCPYQGFLSPQTLNEPPHQPFQTLTQLQQASPTGEVFVNGQFNLPGSVDGGVPYLQTPSASPVPVARSFLQVAPNPHNAADWDWYQGFSPGTDLGTITQIPGCLEAGGPGFNCTHAQSSAFDISGYRLDKVGGTFILTYGVVLGQLWDAFDDVGQDVTGKLRFGVLQTTHVDSDPTKFLHVTWSVTMVGTDRRYPQMLVSDTPGPVQEALDNPNNNTLLVQSITGPSMRVEAQAIHGLVNGNPWDVNNQAPHHAFIDYDNWNANSNAKTIPPAEPPFEHAGLDRLTRFDAYISSGKTYLFMDGTPAGCTQYPSTFALTGTVTVSFGDVLYHEGAEVIYSQVRPFPFMHEHQVIETKRHWDDLGFKSGVAAPVWDATQFPCTPY